MRSFNNVCNDFAAVPPTVSSNILQLEQEKSKIQEWTGFRQDLHTIKNII